MLFRSDLDWWVMENQMIWALLPESEGGDSSSSIWSEYREATKYMNTDECTAWWAKHYENGNMPTRMIAERKSIAHEFESIYSDKSWDKQYGDEVIRGAGLSPATLHTGINDRSILYTYASNVLHYPLNSGFLLSTNEDDLDQKNQEVDRKSVV